MSMIRAILSITHNCWRRWWRQRQTQAALLAYGLLLLASIALAFHAQHQHVQQQNKLSDQAQSDWALQPDRHPHRVVHFGDFVFKPIAPLAMIDWGVDSFTGRSLYLEGHRQNTANFSEAADASGLHAFGRLSPAFCLQVLLPLLLIFLGANLISQERQTRQLLFFAGNGVRLSHLVWGKFLALLSVACVALLPLYGALLWAHLNGEAAKRCLLMGAAYTIYAFMLTAAIQVISTQARSSAQAFSLSLCLWCLFSLLMPRIGAQFAGLEANAPTWSELEMRAASELEQLGNFHNPNDPNFASFRAEVLKKYQVETVEQLPVNFGGLVMIAGERRTSEILAKHVATMREQFHAQNQSRRRLDWINPVLALQTVSMAAAGTDYWHFEDFLLQSEARRYAMVQALNQIHTDHIAYENDREQRLSADFWQSVKRQDYRRADLMQSFANLQASLGALLLWLVVSLMTLWQTAIRVRV
jgi:ABC-2 type transport system permease protein